MATRNSQPGKKSQTGPKGFTLVEMLVVIFIMVILVGLIVGISKLIHNEMSKRQTQGWQGVIVSAVEAYYKTKHVWPAEYTITPPNTPLIPADSDTARRQNNWDAICRSQNLIKQLKPVPQAWDIIAGMSAEAFVDPGVMNPDIATPAQWPDGQAYMSTFVDSWRQYMDFRMVGGRPVVISAGSDGQLGNTSDATQQGYMKDNIRSDAQ